MADPTNAPGDEGARPHVLNRQARWRRRNPHKRRAHQRVKWAKRTGRLTPQPCEVCGLENTEAHHDDYEQPLVVRWLCRRHHRAWHKRMRDIAHG